MRCRTALVVAVVMLVGCATSTDEQAGVAATTPATPTSSSPSPTTLPASTTTLVTTTTTLPATTTSTPPTTTTTPATLPGRFDVVQATLFPADPLPGSDGASGSGCAPGAGPLPSGIWYGHILAAAPSAIDFDLACFYFGEIAWEVAAGVGEEANNDYWIVNDNRLLRTVPLDAEAVVWSIPGDLTDLQPLRYDTEWPPDWERAYAECPGEFCGVWLYVNDGAVTEIVEQYVP